jgi:ribulose-phosphate 3-epimerase
MTYLCQFTAHFINDFFIVWLNNIGEIAAAGADMFVAGSAIFDQPDYKKVIDEMRSELAKVSHE